MQASTRHRLVALGMLAAVGIPAFLIGGRYWVGHVDPAEAVARFRAAGPSAAEVVPGLPVPGVYRYRTTGGEDVSLFGYRREYPSVTVRIVTRRGCGVREEQWFLVQHLEYYDRCGPGLVSYGTDIAYWWTHGTQDFTCEGGSFDGSDLQPGQRSEWVCSDEDTRADQVTEYVGDEEVTVEGRPVRARHTRWSTTFSGATEGGAVVDDWFDPATGLVLREERHIGLKVGSPFVGRLTYADNSTYELLATTPDR
ncbi:MAG TPA: hypothetical protein VG078_11030 [Acidimicrobiales bacterium]|nr:hypothetical protein [Acidimicrobiales bacterium]